MSKPRNPNALTQPLADFIAACEHSYCDAMPSAGPLVQVYYCTHPAIPESKRPQPCEAIFGISTNGCRRRYGGHEAMERRKGA